MNRRKYFSLFSNCIPVKGHFESLICDLERCCYLPITNSLLDVLTLCVERGLSIEGVKANYNYQNNQGIDALFRYIYEQGYGFYTNEPELFSKLSLEWDSPFHLTNAVVEVASNSIHISEEALKQLAKVGCQAVELRLIDEIDVKTITNLLQLLGTSRTRCLFLIMKYQQSISLDDLIGLYLKFEILGQIIVYSSPCSNDFKDEIPPQLFGRIRQVVHPVLFGVNEKISLSSMALNMQAFTEAFSYNLGLNRKISIDTLGNIKNYPSHEKVFGDIQTNKIEDIIELADFQALWSITKNQVQGCKDCQYRYMCVDNIDLIKIGNEYARKNSCSFDPYCNSWK